MLRLQNYTQVPSSHFRKMLTIHLCFLASSGVLMLHWRKERQVCKDNMIWKDCAVKGKTSFSLTWPCNMAEYLITYAIYIQGIQTIERAYILLCTVCIC